MQSPTDEDLGPIWQRLWQEVVSVHLQWQQYHALYVAPSADIPLLNRSASGFFAVLRQTLARDVFLAIARLTDAPEMGKYFNLTLDRLLEVPGVADKPALRRLLEDKLEQLRKQAEPMRRHRHAYLAHLDLEKAVSPDSAPLPGITVEMVDEVLKLIAEAMNAVALALRDTTIAFDDVLQQGDPRALMGRLRDAEKWRDVYFCLKKVGI